MGPSYAQANQHNPSTTGGFAHSLPGASVLFVAASTQVATGGRLGPPVFSWGSTYAAW